MLDHLIGYAAGIARSYLVVMPTRASKPGELDPTNG
jgi:hypothetical protein